MQRGQVRRLAQEVAGRREQQVRLPFRGREGGEEVKERRVPGDRARQFLEPRSPAARLHRERPVVLRSADGKVLTAHRHGSEPNGYGEPGGC
jgi:hypothetical protein